MSSGGKGGSSSSSVQLPSYIEDALRENLDRAQATSRIGYTPYYGPSVAAMTPTQTSAMANTSNLANAFGMQSPRTVDTYKAMGQRTTANPTAGMPQAQNYNGMMAYSSGDIFDQALAQLSQRRPGQYDAITGMFIDPVTGAPSTYDQALLSEALISKGADPSLVQDFTGGDGFNQLFNGRPMTSRQMIEAMHAIDPKKAAAFSIPAGLLAYTAQKAFPSMYAYADGDRHASQFGDAYNYGNYSPSSMGIDNSGSGGGIGGGGYGGGTGSMGSMGGANPGGSADPSSVGGDHY